MILLDVAADGIHSGDAGHGFQLGPDDPILHRSQIRRAFDFGREALGIGCQIDAVGLPTGAADRSARLRRLVADRPHVDFAEAGRHRAHFGLRSPRQARAKLEKALTDLLAREVDIGAVAEHGRHLGKPVARERARVVQPGDAGERRLDGERDLFLDFGGRQGGRDRVDLNLLVRNVWHRIYGKMLK